MLIRSGCDRYLSIMDVAAQTVEHRLLERRQEGTRWRQTGLRAVLNGASGIFGRSTSTFLGSAGTSARFSTLGKAVLKCQQRLSIMNPSSLVSIVDDDESVRESLPDLLKEFGFTPQTFSSAEEFLAANGTSRTKCLILDIAMPGMSGPGLQQELKRRKIDIPIIFITARRDEPERSRLIEQGAVAYLIKPFSDTALLEALNSALPAP